MIDTTFNTNIKFPHDKNKSASLKNTSSTGRNIIQDNRSKTKPMNIFSPSNQLKAPQKITRRVSTIQTKTEPVKETRRDSMSPDKLKSMRNFLDALKQDVDFKQQQEKYVSEILKEETKQPEVKAYTNAKVPDLNLEYRPQFHALFSKAVHNDFKKELVLEFMNFLANKIDKDNSAFLLSLIDMENYISELKQAQRYSLLNVETEYNKLFNWFTKWSMCQSL